MFTLVRSRILQRKCACGQHTVASGECAECRKKRLPLQRRATNQVEPTSVPPIVHEVLRAPGQSLDPATRTYMESRFGHDFSRVRVHIDAKAGESARAVNALAYTVGPDVVFGAGQYAPRTSEGRRLLAHELAHVVQQKNLLSTPSEKLEIGASKDVFETEANAIANSLHNNYPIPQRISQNVIQRQEGPQSFAGAEPGSEALDPILVDRNRVIEQDLLNTAEAFYRDGDLRWFFTYAHGKITQQINNNLSAFQRPNALMRLNIHFAEEFIRALNSQPHAAWQRAFRFCQALQQGASETPALVGETEFCGAAMANVHINVDLNAALREVGCIPPADYGNMLVFVNRGSLAALVRLRGRAIGAAEAMLQHVLAPLVDLEVKAWRNAAFETVCNTPVPPVEPGFSGRIQ